MAEFKLSRKEIIGFVLLTIRCYESGTSVEVDSLADFERRALSRTIGTFWPSLPAAERAGIARDLGDELGAPALETFHEAIGDLQMRAQIEREITELDNPEQRNDL